MLTRLRIQNLALVEDLVLDLGSGFTVLTGETGAGKSLLVDALSLLVGSRGDSDTVRRGEDRAVVEGTLQVPRAPWELFLKTKGFKIEFPIQLRREVSSAGRSRAWINQSVCSLGDLKEIGRLWMRLMSQHDHQSLLNEERHLALLDEVLGIEAGLSPLVNQVQQDQLALRARQRSEADRERRLAELEGYFESLDALDPRIGEWSQLKEEREPLRHAAQLAQLYQEMNQYFEQITPNLDALLRAGHRASGLWSESAVTQDRLKQAVLELEDLKALTQEAVQKWDGAGTHRIEEVENRLALYEKLSRIHRCEPDDLSHLHLRLKQEQKILQEGEDSIEVYEKALKRSAQVYGQAALALHNKRESALPELEQQLHERLQYLGMNQARVQFRLSYGIDPESPFIHEGQRLRIDDQGVSQLSIWIESNAGEGFRPLSKIASGGELSRLMLSLLGAGLHRPDHQGRALTLVLDEVDAGVGGQTAIQVGESIGILGQHHQVLSVTHLAQVAARATHHLFLSKETSSGRTRSRCERLEGEYRVREIARLLSGESQKKETLTLAKSLLKIR